MAHFINTTDIKLKSEYQVNWNINGELAAAQLNYGAKSKFKIFWSREPTVYGDHIPSAQNQVLSVDTV
jgi:hypothetical protein